MDEITTGDKKLSRDEHDPSEPLVWKQVAETFERVRLVYELEVGGQTIGTRAEHPFYVLGKGWTAAGELKPGDRVVVLDPRESVAVTALRLTGRQEKLYNLRVADYHTYFVGDAHWDFSVWAHNNSCGGLVEPTRHWPSTPSEMDEFLGIPGTRIPDLPSTPGRGKVIWEPANGIRIIFEQHPYHPTAPIWHRGPHWHLDLPGVKHQRFLPGDPIPGF
ncbi:MAG: polymorphic toxin-type HINT domain-containing protein [Thermogemmata sp.]